MANKDELRGKWALVTGASSGFGADFARNLADRGCNLILVARREDKLRELQAQLIERYRVQVEVVVLDLVSDDAPQHLYAQVKAMDKQVDVLINNAGLGLYGTFLEIDWQKQRNMLELDIITVAHLTKLFLPDMVQRNFGYVLLVASIGAYQPTPLYASYSAAKSFVLSFGEAVNYELRKTKVRITVVSPGIAATEFLKVSGQQATLYQRMVIMKPRDVTRIAIDRMLKGQPSVVPGWINSVMAWGNRLMPRRVSVAVANRLMK